MTNQADQQQAAGLVQVAEVAEAGKASRMRRHRLKPGSQQPFAERYTRQHPLVPVVRPSTCKTARGAGQTQATADGQTIHQ